MKKHSLVFVIGIVVIIAGIAGFIAYDQWAVEQKTTSLLKAPNVVAKSTDGAHATEGSDTTKVEPDDLSSYSVALDAPRIITIPKLNIEARVRGMGVNTDQSIQSPTNIYDAGWYTGSAKPGQNGAVFIDGHASGASREGLFGYLDTLGYGDVITIEKGDKSTVKYTVVKTETVPLASVDMRAALLPYEGVSRGLTLMTCTGAWVKDRETLDHRVVVYARQVE